MLTFVVCTIRSSTYADALAACLLYCASLSLSILFCGVYCWCSTAITCTCCSGRIPLIATTTPGGAGTILHVSFYSIYLRWRSCWYCSAFIVECSGYSLYSAWTELILLPDLTSCNLLSVTLDTLGHYLIGDRSFVVVLVLFCQDCPVSNYCCLRAVLTLRACVTSHLLGYPDIFYSIVMLVVYSTLHLFYRLNKRYLFPTVYVVRYSIYRLCLVLLLFITDIMWVNYLPGTCLLLWLNYLRTVPDGWLYDWPAVLSLPFWRTWTVVFFLFYPSPFMSDCVRLIVAGILLSVFGDLLLFWRHYSPDYVVMMPSFMEDTCCTIGPLGCYVVEMVQCTVFLTIILGRLDQTQFWNLPRLNFGVHYIQTFHYSSLRHLFIWNLVVVFGVYSILHYSQSVSNRLYVFIDFVLITGLLLLLLYSGYITVGYSHLHW